MAHLRSESPSSMTTRPQRKRCFGRVLLWGWRLKIGERRWRLLLLACLLQLTTISGENWEIASNHSKPFKRLRTALAVEMSLAHTWATVNASSWLFRYSCSRGVPKSSRGYSNSLKVFKRRSRRHRFSPKYLIHAAGPCLIPPNLPRHQRRRRLNFSIWEQEWRSRRDAERTTNSD